MYKREGRMKLSEIIRNSRKPISMKHEQWLANSPDNIVWSVEALQFAQEVLSNQVGGARDRTTSFRASGIASCKRRQVFKAIGMQPETTVSTDLKNIFITGNFYHLKWQMMGITAGWLKQAEVPYINEKYDFGGTADGVLYDDSLLEVKSANDRSYSSTYDSSTISHTYKMQANAYMFLSGAERTSFIFENKNNSDWSEHVLTKSNHYQEIVESTLEDLSSSMNNKELPRVLDDCLAKVGKEYKQCPFKKQCMELKKESWVNDQLREDSQ